MLGSPRSGSTWLLSLLGAHDLVVPVNEPLIGMYLSPFISDNSGWDPRGLDRSSFTFRQVQRTKRHQFFAAEFDDVTLPALGEMLRARFLAQVIRYASPGKARSSLAIVKEPAGSQSADLLSAAMPNSKILFLLRDGRDVVDSALAANLEGSWVTREFPGARGLGPEQRLGFIVDQAHKWLWRTEIVQAAVAGHPSQTLVLKYEDLLQDQVGKLALAFSWLGLTVTRAELAATVAQYSFESVPEEQRGDRSFHRSAAPGAWRQNLSREEIEALEAILGPKLEELGYVG